MNNPVSLTPIGKVLSPYKEKFAIPRQSNLVSLAKGTIELTGPYAEANLVKTLEQFSHIWVIFLFHETMGSGWKPMVRPPRLGGNEKVGVLATRSTFRPNPIGMSVVKLDGISLDDKKVALNISGLDLLDQTPVLDIKPYIPYADAISEARGGYADSKPTPIKQVTFTEQANEFCNQTPKVQVLKEFIEQVLSQDPRPAYKQKKADNKTYGIRLYDYNIHWQVKSESLITVTQITKE